MKEEWRPIPGYDGYEVSDQGNVRSYYKLAGSPRGYILTDKPQRILRGALKAKGYRFVILRADGKSHNKMIHQLMLLAFVGPCPDGMEACHNDSNPKNNRLDNLRYDTHEGNLRDRCPLSPELLTCLRYQVANGENVNNLIKAYGVDRSFIIDVCSGRTYSTLGSGPITETKEIQCHKIDDDKYRMVIELIASGVSQNKAAKQAGVHYSTVSRWVNGSRSKERWNQAKQSIPLDNSAFCI